MKRVLVTGASAGLGREFAWQLAPEVEELWLVARRRERLDALADELRGALGVDAALRVEVRALDLTVAGAREALVEEVEGREGGLDLLVNNAGRGDYGLFEEAQWGDVEQQLRLNVEALTAVSYGFLPALKRARGGLLHVSSVAGELPMPDMAVYAATKAYVSSFSEALQVEMQEFGVRVSALCPGPTPTEFGEVARRVGQERSRVSRPSFFVERPEAVVAAGLAGVARNRSRIFPGVGVRALGHGLHVLPRSVLRALLRLRFRRAPLED